ncbi:unnamed protein product [Ixodes hexagonus]
MVYRSLSWANLSIELETDPVDEAILRQLHRVRLGLFPHWKVLVNVFVDRESARIFSEEPLSDALYGWMDDRHVDGVNFEFDPDSFQVRMVH